MGFVNFMSSTAGRVTRGAAGVALILIGLLAVKGTAGIVIAIIGLVPLSAGVFNFCLFGPLFGVGLRGRATTR
jgi:hypothetical protein